MLLCYSPGLLQILLCNLLWPRATILHNTIKVPALTLSSIDLSTEPTQTWPSIQPLNHHLASPHPPPYGSFIGEYSIHPSWCPSQPPIALSVSVSTICTSYTNAHIKRVARCVLFFPNKLGFQWTYTISLCCQRTNFLNFQFNYYSNHGSVILHTLCPYLSRDGSNPNPRATLCYVELLFVAQSRRLEFGMGENRINVWATRVGVTNCVACESVVFCLS